MGRKKCFRGRTFTEIGLLNAKKEALRWECLLKCLLNFWEIPTQGGNDNREFYLSSSRAFVLLAMMGAFASLKCQMLASVMCK